MPKIRVAMITPAELPVPAVRGGAIETLMDHLIAENEDKGLMDLTVYSYGTSQAVKIAQGMRQCKWEFYWEKPIHRVVYRAFAKMIRIFSLRKKTLLPLWSYVVFHKLHRKQFDVILVEGCPHMVAMLQHKGNVALHIHTDLMYPGMPFSKSAFDGSKRIIAVSKYIAGRICEIEPARSEKVCVVPNCVNTKIFDKSLYREFRDEFRKKNGIGSTDRVFYFCGRVDPTKGVDHVVKAFCNLPQENVWLVIIGGSWFQGASENIFIQNLKSLAQKKKSHILFTGYVPHQDIPQYIAACDIAVLPSVCMEAALLTAIEAISSGVAVITTDRGGIPEYAKENAIVLSANEQLDQQLLQAMQLPLEEYPGSDTTRQIFREKYNTKMYYRNMYEEIRSIAENETEKQF